MGRVVVIDYVSVDGVVQGPGHVGEDSDGGFKQGGWTRPHLGEHAQYLAGPFTAAGGFLLGRVTYDIWLEYWPNVTDAGDLIARALNTKPKYVASASLANPDWAGTTVLRDVPREVAELREKPSTRIGNVPPIRKVGINSTAVTPNNLSVSRGICDPLTTG